MEELSHEDASSCKSTLQRLDGNQERTGSDGRFREALLREFHAHPSASFFTYQFSRVRENIQLLSHSPEDSPSPPWHRAVSHVSDSSGGYRSHQKRHG